MFITLLICQAFRLLVCDACAITDEEYSKVVNDFIQDIYDKDIQAVRT